MDSTTLVTFTVHVPSARSVHLLGSWDNFSKPYPMYKDARKGRGHWRGCHKFENIMCDGGQVLSTRRAGGLKMGGEYWYYYELDGEKEYYDPATPSTTKCPFLPGQPVNVLEVPIELGGEDVEASEPELPKLRTIDPEDRYAALRVPASRPPTRASTSPATLQEVHGSDSLSVPSTAVSVKRPRTYPLRRLFSFGIRPSVQRTVSPESLFRSLSLSRSRPTARDAHEHKPFGRHNEDCNSTEGTDSISESDMIWTHLPSIPDSAQGSSEAGESKDLSLLRPNSGDPEREEGLLPAPLNSLARRDISIHGSVMLDDNRTRLEIPAEIPEEPEEVLGDLEHSLQEYLARETHPMVQEAAAVNRFPSVTSKVSATSRFTTTSDQEPTPSLISRTPSLLSRTPSLRSIARSRSHRRPSALKVLTASLNNANHASQSGTSAQNIPSLPSLPSFSDYSSDEEQTNRGSVDYADGLGRPPLCDLGISIEGRLSFEDADVDSKRFGVHSDRYELNETTTGHAGFRGYSLPDDQHASELTLTKSNVTSFNEQGINDPDEAETTIDRLLNDLGYLGDVIF